MWCQVILSMTNNSTPNVLLIMADQMKSSILRMYSEIGIETPALERLVNEGVRFEHAITPHPLCVPARTSKNTKRASSLRPRILGTRKHRIRSRCGCRSPILTNRTKHRAGTSICSLPRMSLCLRNARMSTPMAQRRNETGC